MYVVERGEGAPLILLHGFGVDHRLLLALDPVLAAAGEWRRMYFDLPGHGGSPLGGVASAEDLVEAVEAEIEARIGTEPFAIIGNSFGGMIARRIAHHRREQVLGLAVIAPVMVAEHAKRRVPERTVIARDPRALAELGDAAGSYEEMAVVQTRENADAFLAHAHPGLTAADPAALERLARSYALEVEPEIASPAPFAQPALFVTGRQDHVVGYEDAWDRIEHYPRATFAVVDSAGHNLHLDQPGLVAALISEWLSRVRRSRSSKDRFA